MLHSSLKVGTPSMVVQPSGSSNEDTPLLTGFIKASKLVKPTGNKDPLPASFVSASQLLSTPKSLGEEPPVNMGSLGKEPSGSRTALGEEPPEDVGDVTMRGDKSISDAVGSLGRENGFDSAGGSMVDTAVPEEACSDGMTISKTLRGGTRRKELTVRKRNGGVVRKDERMGGKITDFFKR